METVEYTVTEFHGSDGQCRGSLADLVLDAHMIPRCGLIPAFRVVAALCRSGGSRGGMSPGCVWQPFELSEDVYWQTVQRLEQFTSDELTSRHRAPHIVGEIRPDMQTPAAFAKKEREQGSGSSRATSTFSRRWILAVSLLSV